LRLASHAGIADQHVNAAEGGLRVFGQRLYLLGLSQVSHQAAHTRTSGPATFCHRLQHGLIPIGQNEIGTVFGIGRRNGLAKAAGCACDQGDTVTQIEEL
jgi:hypothetical protein